MSPRLPDPDDGDIAFTVEGDCCSYSYFYDFLGVRRLLEHGPILDAYFKELDDPDPEKDEDAARGECVIAYGVVFVTEHPRFGEVSSVMSFRNDSNGYYGGWMYATDPSNVSEDAPEDAAEWENDWNIRRHRLVELTNDCMGLIH
jgi:hypothetical protein